MSQLGDVASIIRSKNAELPALRAIKVSMPRPRVQGSVGDRDMHGGQQYVALLDLPVPD